MKRLKTITSYVGHSRFLSECDQDENGDNVAVGYIPSHLMPATNRYASGPSWRVLRWNGKRVLTIEVSHKRYEVWEIDASAIRFSEEQATEEYIASLHALPGSGRIRHAGQS